MTKAEIQNDITYVIVNDFFVGPEATVRRIEN